MIFKTAREWDEAGRPLEDCVLALEAIKESRGLSEEEEKTRKEYLVRLSELIPPRIKLGLHTIAEARLDKVYIKESGFGNTKNIPRENIPEFIEFLKEAYEL